MTQSSSGGVVLFAAAFFLPFLVGMVAGINVAFVGGAMFSLLLGLLHSPGLFSRLYRGDDLTDPHLFFAQLQ